MSQVPDLTAQASELVTYTARLHRAIRRGSDVEAPPTLVRVLSILDELGPSTVTAIAAADLTSQPTATTTVNALVERGWVEKRDHPDDARACLVSMTQAGRDTLTGTRRTHGELLASRLAPYTSDDVARAVALIRHLLES
ncbi:MAG: MarR family transcriptional regulator [Nocardioidaceae bacterium]